MKRTLVDSSMMASVGYDAKQATLEIEFRTGDVYDYFDVPRAVFRALLVASSRGASSTRRSTAPTASSRSHAPAGGGAERPILTQ